MEEEIGLEQNKQVNGVSQTIELERYLDLVDRLREKDNLLMIHPPKLIEYLLDCQNLSNERRVEKALANTNRLVLNGIEDPVKPITAFDFFGCYTRLNDY